ncbi:MAG: acyltransferase [Bacteroides sp.]|nr:acyltransferase [Bacteroides sp.]
MKDELSANRTFLMGLAMIAVVCFHHGWVVIPGFTAVFSRFGLWGVDVFLFLSGFGCVYALNKYSVLQFYKKRLNRLWPTCLLVGILIICVNQYFHAEKIMTYLPVRLFSIHRWYIQAILICYAICPLAYVVMKRFRAWGLLLLIVIAVVIEWLLPEVKVWKINWAFGRLPVFLIGMYVGMFDLKLTKAQYIISGLCLVLAVVTRCVGVTRYVGGYYVFRWTYFLAAAMPFICETLCRLRLICMKLRVYRMIELCGIYSLEIYLIHEYFYWALGPIGIPLYVKYALYGAILSLLCVIAKKSTDFISDKMLR